MTDRKPCSAFQDDRTCKNGFPATAVCYGIDGGTPICMNEAICARIYKMYDGVPPVIARNIVRAVPRAELKCGAK